MTDYTATLTAEAWQLYTTSMDCDAAAEAINDALTSEVQAAKARLEIEPALSKKKIAEQVRDAVYAVMNFFTDHGARDTEPEVVLVAELERIFGLRPYSLER